MYKNRLAYGLVFLVAVFLAGCATQSKKPIDQDLITLVQSKRGAAIAVSDRLLFDIGKSEVKAQAEKALDQVADILKTPKYATTNVLVEGHTDNQGSAVYNEKLSIARATAVRQALLARNVQPNRLIAKGYGLSEPVAANDTEENRQKNRRVEVVFPQETVDSLKAGMEDKFDFNSVVSNALDSIKGLFK